ncbi:MAG: hypothetical protein K0R15_1500 [Clostridiales bacterium]|jgi:2-dehydro-3-deoxygalactonokinase|nr:hypothetical protein [Clostridiales bacterium]
MIKITVDVGTTNSRIKIIEDNQVISTAKSNIGIKDVAIYGNKTILEKNLVNLINEGLLKVDRKLDDVEYIVASGMITSNLGLVEVPHRKSPVSIDDLSNNIIRETFSWLDNKPFYFIPGIKNDVPSPSVQHLNQIDVMRGEEVEAFGIINVCNIKGPALMILPGSHTKFVFVNEQNEVEKCSTTMLGEFLFALSTATILSNSLSPDLITEVDEEYVKMGVNFERNNGVTKSAFAVRLMDISLETTPNQRANFLTGALISNDIGPRITQEIEDKYNNIYIGGSSPLKDVFKIVLDHKGIPNINTILLPDDITSNAASVGALLIAERHRQSDNSIK